MRVESTAPDLRTLAEPGASSRERVPAPVSAAALFVAFATIGLCGFGGILPWARRTLVDTKAWLTDQEFTELLGFAQVLPGANGTHLAVMFGARRCGWRGALAAVTGLLIPPFVILIALALLYRWYGKLPEVHGALKGMAAVAAGLSIETGLRLARALTRRIHTVVLGLLPFVAIAVLHLPLVHVMVVLVPAAIVCEFAMRKHASWAASRIEGGKQGGGSA
ncbi:chromate transporter [Trinickia fusca]|uniref:Chromate transporter n=1 Tax=Trinickia fusca TaxID=2419777 RepID=A0A494XJZ1_9BURK|nr:chromate transporter [Trinickia fusca]RKP50990.1 chromate transporter [Trinickia fusca]